MLGRQKITEMSFPDQKKKKKKVCYYFKSILTKMYILQIAPNLS